MKAVKILVVVVVAFALIAGIGLCLYISFTKTLTANESLMVNILVTLFAIFISWIVTHLYSQLNLEARTEEVRKQHEENIRTYAIKAAEKVYNLSNELKRLTERLETSIEELSESEDTDICNLVLKEKIISTIHLMLCRL